MSIEIRVNHDCVPCPKCGHLVLVIGHETKASCDRCQAIFDITWNKTKAKPAV